MAIQTLNSWIQSGSSLNNVVKLGALVAGAAIAGKACYGIYKRSIQERPFGYIPPHLSPEAKAWYAAATPVGDPITDPSLWPIIRKGFSDATIAVSIRERDTYIQETHEKMIGSVPVLVAIPKDYKPNDRAFVYIHGGGWALGNYMHLIQIFAAIAHKTSMKTYAINYRLAPEHPFPKGLDDCLEVYKELLKTHKPEDIFFLGDSAGANLCIATILKARDAGLPLPAAVGLNSPVVDLEENSVTYRTFEGRDPKIKSLASCVEAYAQGQDLKNPLMSVIHADFKEGFPPTTIHVGGTEVLLGDAARLDEKLTLSGQQSSLHVFDGLWHGVQEHGFPESEPSFEMMSQFFRSHFKKEEK